MKEKREKMKETRIKKTDLLTSDGQPKMEARRST
jgi:hypothetical protein